jgi:hypothetical protein
LVGQLEFCAGLIGAKLMIPLVVDHLMSTYFRGGRREELDDVRSERN